MNREAHLAALRAAARVALATSIIVGCAANSDEDSEKTKSDTADLTSASEDLRFQDCCWWQDSFGDIFDLGDASASSVADAGDAGRRPCSTGPACTPWGPPVPPAMPARAVA